MASPGLHWDMSIWDIEIEEVSGPWYPLERDTDGSPTEDAESDRDEHNEDGEERDFLRGAADGDRSTGCGSETFRWSTVLGDKRRDSLLKLADDVAPDLFRSAFDAGYVFLLSLLVERAPSEHSALVLLLSGVEIPVSILLRAHLFVATARLVSWSVARLSAIADNLVSTALFLLVLLLAVLLLSVSSMQIVLLTQGTKELLERLAMTAWLSTYDSCDKYLVCLPRRRDSKYCTLPAWCQVSANSTNSSGLDAFVYDMLTRSDQGQLIQMIQEIRGQSLEYFVRLYAFATCAWAFALGDAAWAAVKMQRSMCTFTVSAWRISVRHRQRQLVGRAARMDALCTAAALRSIVHGKSTPAEPIVIRALSPPCRWSL